MEFISYLSLNPLEGNVIPNGGGIRKLRWSGSGKGKQGGVRVIYYNVLNEGNIFLLDIYAKNTQTNVSIKNLNLLKGNIK